MKPRFIFFYLIIITFILGCLSLPDRGKEKDLSGKPLLEPQSSLKFSDVPVPAGFKLLSENSYSFENAGLRIGLLKYQGKADPDQVVNFYKEQMPMYNWRTLNIVEYGERLMNFDREQETCIVTLAPKGKEVVITLSVGPKSQASKKQEKPIK